MRSARGAHRPAQRRQGRRRRRTRRLSPRRPPPARARAPPGRARPAPRRRLRAPARSARHAGRARTGARSAPEPSLKLCPHRGRGSAPQTRRPHAGDCRRYVHARHLRQHAMEARNSTQNNTDDGVDGRDWRQARPRGAARPAAGMGMRPSAQAPRPRGSALPTQLSPPRWSPAARERTRPSRSR